MLIKINFYSKLKDGSDIDLYFGLYAVANKDSGHVRKRRGVEVQT